MSRFSDYVKSGKLCEVMTCIIIGLLLGIVPYFTFSLNQRPIPYQITEAGDVILDMTFGNALVSDTVPAFESVIYGGLIPLVIQIILCVCLGESDDTHLTICVYFVANGITRILTDFLKFYCGYLRPNFYSLCEFDKEESLSCQGSAHALKDSRISFISGHSSFSFCCFTIFTLYLLRLFGVNGLYYSRKGNNDNNDNIVIGNDLEDQRNQYPPKKASSAIIRMISVLCICPMFAAFFIAASRVHDNHHHPADVVAGSIIGYAIAKFVYDTWFYSVPAPQEER